MIRCAECKEPIPTSEPQVTMSGTDVRHMRCSPPNPEIVYVWGWLAQMAVEQMLAER